MAETDKRSGSAFNWQVYKRLLRYVKPYRWTFVLAVILTIGIGLVAPIRPQLFRTVINDYVPAGDILGVRLYIALALALTFSQGILEFFSAWVTSWLGQRIILDIRKELFRKILGMQIRQFDTTTIGTLQTRVVSDIETLNSVFSQGLISITGELLQVFTIILSMFLLDWEMTLVVMASLPLLLIATWIFKNAVRKAFQEVRTQVTKMNTFLQEHISGMMVIQIFGREKEELETFKKLNAAQRDANIRSIFHYAVFFPVVEFVSAIALSSVVWYGTRQVLEDPGYSPGFGTVLAFMLYINMFFRPIRMLADQFNTLQMGIVSGERIFRLLDEIEEETVAEPATADVRHRPAAIQAEQVSFAYKEGEPVLNNVSFDLQPGHKLAIVGATGAGKSTIIQLILRFYPITSGRMLVDGTDVRELVVSELRSRIGLVLQDVFLFSGSVKENISLLDPAISDDDVIRAARLAGAHEFILKLPDGYEYQVRERGATLSSGQRQLIAFARILAFNPGILILDEATANIDTESEQRIQHAIDTVLTGRTSILIAHRLSTIRKADEILVLDKGAVVERGTHEQLMQQQGAYFALARTQMAEV